MMGFGFSSTSEALLLIALGIGYIVCYLANREEKALRSAGYLIGVFIITLSALLILSTLFINMRICNMGKMGMGQRMMMKGQMPAATPAPVPQK